MGRGVDPWNPEIHPESCCGCRLMVNLGELVISYEDLCAIITRSFYLCAIKKFQSSYMPSLQFSFPYLPSHPPLLALLSLYELLHKSAETDVDFH